MYSFCRTVIWIWWRTKLNNLKGESEAPYCLYYSSWPSYSNSFAYRQSCGSGSESGFGSIGSVYFWASWIRIRIHKSNVWIRILLSLSHNCKKNFDFYCFVTSFWLLSLKNDVNVPSKSNKQQNFQKNSFLLASWRSMKKISGFVSASGSISQRHRSADPDPDPDPHQTVMDPQHGFKDLLRVYIMGGQRSNKYL